jgi:hypothetical protein
MGVQLPLLILSSTPPHMRPNVQMAPNLGLFDPPRGFVMV